DAAALPRWRIGRCDHAHARGGSVMADGRRERPRADREGHPHVEGRPRRRGPLAAAGLPARQSLLTKRSARIAPERVLHIRLEGTRPGCDPWRAPSAARNACGTPAPEGATLEQGIRLAAQSPPCAATAASRSAAVARKVTLPSCRAICFFGSEAGPLSSSTTTRSSSVISLILPSRTLSEL